MSDLEVLQHPLSKWGHSKTPFAVTTSQMDFHVATQVGGATTRDFTCRRLCSMIDIGATESRLRRRRW
jgi:hypothetical protein